MSPPINALSPYTCPPIWGDKSRERSRENPGSDDSILQGLSLYALLQKILNTTLLIFFLILGLTNYDQRFYHWSCFSHVSRMLVMSLKPTICSSVQLSIPGDSRQVITGDQGQKFCKTLPAHFERRDSGVLMRRCWSSKTKLLGLRLSFQFHKLCIYASLNVTWKKQNYMELFFCIPCSCNCKPWYIAGEQLKL